MRIRNFLVRSKIYYIKYVLRWLDRSTQTRAQPHATAASESQVAGWASQEGEVAAAGTPRPRAELELAMTRRSAVRREHLERRWKEA